MPLRLEAGNGPLKVLATAANGVVVTSCGRLCLYNKKINLSVSLAGQAVGVKEVDDGIWLVSFINYDLGYIDLEEKTLQPCRIPSGQKCNPCLRNVLLPMSPERTEKNWSGREDLNLRPPGPEPDSGAY